MVYKPTSIDSIHALPRDGGVAYAAQETWVFNDTIKGNILFGSDFDEERYKKGLGVALLVNARAERCG